MKANKDTKLAGLAGPICKGENITNSIYICKSNLIRVVAVEQTTLKTSKFNNEGDGILIPQGTIEYFKVEKGEILTISGSINISSVY